MWFLVFPIVFPIWPYLCIQFCMRFSVLADFVCGFAVLNEYFFGFAVSSIPQCLPPRVSGPGSSSGRGHCVVFLHKTLNSHSLLHQGAQLGTGKLLWKANKFGGSRDLRWTSIPSRGSRNTSSRVYATETGISSGSYEPVGSKDSHTI